jgi:hypothetical protein
MLQITREPKLDVAIGLLCMSLEGPGQHMDNLNFQEFIPQSSG